MSGHRRQSKTQPTITVFAGPNGSGKTTLTNQFALEGCIDNLVNADQMAAMLASEEGLSTPTLQQQHQAAHAAEALRWEMIKNKESFTTETVMSDSARWQKFFESARQQGYRLKLQPQWRYGQDTAVSQPLDSATARSRQGQRTLLTAWVTRLSKASFWPSANLKPANGSSSEIAYARRDIRHLLMPKGSEPSVLRLNLWA